MTYLSSLCILFSHSIPASDISPQLLGVLRTDTTETQFGDRFIPLRDQNGDGFDDILVFELFRNKLFYGGSPFDTVAALVFDSTNNRTNCVGDINNDGFCDFTALGRSNFNWKLNLYFGGPTIDTVRDLWFGTDTLSAIGYSVTGDDINDNGKDEIISWEGISQKSVVLFELGSNSDSIPDLEIKAANDPLPSTRFGRGIASGDFNGDGNGDLAVSYNNTNSIPQNGSIFLYWGNSSFDSIPDLILARMGSYNFGKSQFGVILESLGDVNGDSFEDIFASSGGASGDTLGFIYFGGPAVDTLPDVTIATHHNKARAAGDVNNDGCNDVIVSLWTTFSTIGWVEIFLGGPEMDSIADVRFDVRDEPIFNNYFGLDCSGIGDFNGDGIDDFAFSSRLSGGRYVVYIYSGWDVATGIEIEQEDNLPKDFMISQNYPNPFNSSTKIEFSLPERRYLVLTIYNMLGQRVQILVDGELSAGSYSVTWDGKDESGSEIPSGVYIYELTSAIEHISKKMIYLK